MADSANDAAIRFVPLSAGSLEKPPRGRAARSAFQKVDTAYIRDLIAVLQGHPSGRRRWSIMNAIRTNRRNAGLDIPHQIENEVERAFLEYCADSENFKKRGLPPERALFYWPQGRVAGVWAVYPDRAESFVAELSIGKRG